MTATSDPTAEAARAWVDAWSAGWSSHDVAAIAERYSADCVFRSHPFRSAASGAVGAATWIREAFEEERSARFVFGDPIVSPEGRAAIEYRAVITGLDGRLTTLAGTTVLRFDAHGLVADHRDYWAITEGDLGLDPIEEHA